MVPENHEVHEVHHELAEDDGELVPGYQGTALVSRSDLGNVHRADGGSHTHAYAAEHPVEVEGNPELERRLSLGEEEKFRIIGARSAEEETDTCNEEALLAAEPAGHESGNGTSYDAAQQGAGGSDAVQEAGIGEVLGTHEECLKTSLST